MMGLSAGTSDMTLNLRDRVWGRRPLWESGNRTLGHTQPLTL